MINYLPELFGGIILVLLTFYLTRLSEKSKAKEQLRNQQNKFESEKEKIIWKHSSKLKEQELKFNQELDLLKQKHELELEKFNIESRDRDMKSIFTGEYDMNEMASQLEGLDKLLGKTKNIQSKHKNHPAFKK